MKYCLLEANQRDDSKGFENARFHAINYILRQGKILIKTPCKEKRLRPQCNEREFGTVVSDDFFYSYSIDSLKGNNNRTISIVVGSSSQKKLEDEVSILTKNNSLRKDC